DPREPARGCAGGVMATGTTHDRRAALANQSALNGIDFVEILDDSETRLRVHFLAQAPDQTALAAAVTGATITGGQTIPEVAVSPITAASWGAAGGYPTLDLVVDAPGDFSTYTLHLSTATAILDPYFERAAFSFKARCKSTMDCEAPAPECPPEADDTPP